MRGEKFSSLLLLLVVFAVGLPAAAQQTLYDNGPINGQTDGWTINLGFAINDTFTVSGGNSTVTGMVFGAWLVPGDTLESVDLTMASQPLGGGTVYFEGVVNFTQSGCFLNTYSYAICTETASFNGPSLSNGTYWVTLENAVSADGNPVYWDENSGVGCNSPGCPSQAKEGDDGSIPSESFTILGTTQTGGSTPEPCSLMLFASGFVGVVGFLRRKRL